MPYISKNFIKDNDFICHISNLYAIDNSSNLNLFPNPIRPIMANNFGYRKWFILSSVFILYNFIDF